jgi:hypothetical protein
MDGARMIRHSSQVPRTIGFGQMPQCQRPPHARGRQVFGADFADETLGFSLKPPKWLRKAQPGKILKKAAIPLAIAAGTLLIPGVGGAAVKGLTAVGGAALKGTKGLARFIGLGKKALPSDQWIATATGVNPSGGGGLIESVKSFAAAAQPILTATGVLPPGGLPASPMSVPPPASVPWDFGAGGGGGGGGGGVPVSPPATAIETASTTGGEMPPWVIPAAAAAVVLLALNRRR